VETPAHSPAAFSVITGAAQRLEPRHFAETADGLARFLWFALGRPEMDEQDWRQFEITQENAQRMVDEGNADLVAGVEIWVNYGHDGSGPRAGDVVRFELGADGGVYGVVRWNEKAKASIRQTPPEWKYFSPEFYASQVFTSEGEPVFENGRLILQPFHISGGGLVNTPAMKKLAVVANAHRGGPGPGGLHAPASGGSTPPPGTTPQNHSPGEASRKEEPMKLPLTMKALGLADGTSQEDVDSTVAKVVQERDELKQKLAAERPDPPDVEKMAAGMFDRFVAKYEKQVESRVEAKYAEMAAAEKVQSRATSIVKRLEAAGKLVADNREVLTKLAASDPDGLEKLEPTLPVIAAVEPFISGHAADPAEGDSAAIDAKAREIKQKAEAAGKPMSYSQAVIEASRKKEA
jgi:phage I-like protein